MTNYLIYINKLSEAVVADKENPADESKHIRFRDKDDVNFKMLLAMLFGGFIKPEQTFDIPEGLSLRFEEEIDEYVYPYGSLMKKVALLVQEPKVEERKEEPYFKVSRNDYGKGFLYYMPSEEAGRFKCWMPLDEDLYLAIERMLKKSSAIKAEEQLKERQEYQPDIHQIVIASNVIRFLNQYIHGIAAGRTEEKNKLNLIDAADHFKNLKF